MSDDLRVISEGAMPDPLRGKLKALVEEWRGQVTKSDRAFGYRLLAAASIKECADQLAALLAESEPEPGLVKCDDCGALVPETQDGRSLRHRCNGPRPDCEAKAKLPLGHPYSTWVDGEGPCSNTDGGWMCGQPRSAHEPKP